MPGTNTILPFCETDTTTNLLSDAAYLADAQRVIGNQSGTARSVLVNKALRQVTLVCSAVAQFTADNQAGNVSDSTAVATVTSRFTAALNALIAAAISALSLASYALLGAAQTFTKAQRGAIVALPATTGTVTLDMSLANNFAGTLTGGITLANPTGLVEGQSGVIAITNGATPYTIAYGSYFKGLSGALPALTAFANAKDTLAYYVDSATHITITSLGDIR